MRTPLQIVLIRDAHELGTNVYADTLRLAFEGSAGTAGPPSTYLDDAVDLGVRVLEPVEGIADEGIARLLNGARHTIAVAIGDANGLTDRFVQKLDSSDIVRVAAPSPKNAGEIQGEKVSDGIEPALAPVVTALRAMQSARRVLTRDTEGDDGGESGFTLFISHAKTDGVAAATEVADRHPPAIGRG